MNTETVVNKAIHRIFLTFETEREARAAVAFFSLCDELVSADLITDPGRKNKFQIRVIFNRDVSERAN